MSSVVVYRLSDEEQARIDEAWVRMVASDRDIDRILLLDAILAMRLHEIGVDRLHFESEKDVEGGTVLMEIHYDRVQPAADDVFRMTYCDARGRVLREERFARDEVEYRLGSLYGAIRPPEALKGAARRRWVKDAEAAREVRMKEIATLLGEAYEHDGAGDVLGPVYTFEVLEHAAECAPE